MFYLRVKLRFYGLDEKSFFCFTFKIISGACQDIGIGGVGAVSWVVSEVLSNCRYVCSRCLSMLGHSGINIASGFSNIHLSTRACDFVYHTCSHVQRHSVLYVEELPNSTTSIQNYNFKFCSQMIVPFNETQYGVSDPRCSILQIWKTQKHHLWSHI